MQGLNPLVLLLILKMPLLKESDVQTVLRAGVMLTIMHAFFPSEYKYPFLMQTAS
jgi:hypothetical protein